MNALFRPVRNALGRCALAAILSLFSLTAIASPPPAGVAPVSPPTGGLAIDGDLLANTPGANAGDWLRMTNVANGTGGGVLNPNGAPLNNLITFHFTDPYGAEDSVFKGGYKWFENPSNWGWTTNKSSGKTDINNALLHIASDADGHLWTMISADRASTSGDSYIDFEFLQNNLTRTSTNTFYSAGPHGGRTTNDLLLSLAFTSGGSVADCFVWRWLPNGAGGFAYSNVTASVPAGRFFVALNTNSISVPYGAFGKTNYDANAFAEAAVDLTALLGAFDPCLSIGVKTILIKTKASQSDSATIEDFIDPIQYTLRIGPSADAGADQKRCSEGSETQFRLSGVATAGIYPVVSNVWSVISGAAIIDSPESLVTTARVSSASATLRLRVYQANGCTESDDVVLTVGMLPVCSINGTASMCPRSTGQFSAPLGMDSYNWSISGNGSTSGATNASVLNVLAGAECGQKFTLTLIVFSNGCPNTCTMEVMAQDNTAPTIACPANVILDCPADTGTNVTGVAVAQDGCGSVSVNYSDIVHNGCPGTKVIDRIWTAIDGCGNTNSCVQTITVRDIAKPTISCPANVVLEYPANADPLATGVATASDTCSTPTVTHSDNVTPGCGKTMMILRTWMAVDECGNSATCDQLISVLDTTRPAITCAQNKTVECTTAWDFDEPTATDAGGDVIITIVNTATNSVGSCGNAFEAIRTWRATDPCGNFAECSQKVTVVDTTKPTISCVGNKTVECTAEWNFDAPTASDSCGNVTVTIVSTTTNKIGHCGNTFDATRTWRATDDCRNYAECSQTVTLEDRTNPSITCVGDKTVECTSAWDFDAPTANDTCGAITIAVISTITNMSEHCGQTFDATRTWRATDECGNYAECSQTVTLVDTTKPTMSCVADKMVECTASWNFDPPTASDTCGIVDVIVVSTTTNKTGHCGNTFEATRVWRATDQCGNYAECSQTVTLVDTTKPTITCVADKTVECTSIWNFDSPSASDSCGNVSVTIVSTTTNKTGHCGNTFDATRTWRATDDCGNFAECSQKVTIVDTTKPVITCVGNKTVECTSVWNFDQPAASDSCGNVSLTVVSATTNKTGHCGNTFDTTRTWRATDDCGNFAECSQKVTVVDTTRPTIICIGAKTVECTSIWNFDSPTAADTCGNVNVTIVSTSTNKTGHCGNTFDATRIWRATDDCGNFAECSQKVTVVDTTKPVITCVGNKTVECTSSWNFDSPSASDSCGIVSVTIVSTSTNKVGHCGNTFDATRIWRATDDCGNFAECSQTVTVVDTTRPAITCAANKTIECTSAWDFDAPTAADGCGSVTITIVGTTTNKTGHCGNTFDATRIWRATDQCGNFAECSQKVTVVDTTRPTINCVANKTVECASAWTFDQPNAADTCGSVAIAVINTITNRTGHCGNTFDATRTWRATDDCGNFGECSQTVTVVDTTKPTIVCPADAVLECPADTRTNFTGVATAQDDCGSVTISYSDALTSNCANTKVIARTWTATDHCGNSSSCVQMIAVRDTVKPTIICPTDRIIECSGDTSPNVMGTATAQDGCGTVTVGYTDVVTPGCGATRTIARTWTATDACGNSATCVQTIAVRDTTPPALTLPANRVLQCPGDTRTNVTGLATAVDGCGSVAVSYSDVVSNGCGLTRTVLRLWTAIDQCGNSTNGLQTISVIDTNKPSLTCPSINVQCVTDVPAAYSDLAAFLAAGGKATDTCSSALSFALISDSGLVGRCPGTVTRLYRVTDVCGNFAECTQTITVHDTIAPVLTCPTSSIIECGSSLATATATDNCTANVSVTFSDAAVQSQFNINFYAADADSGTGPYSPTYLKLAPASLPRPVGRALDPLRNAVAYAPSGQLDALTSLGGVPMSFGQVIPFEAVIQASGGQGPEHGTIEFTVDWATHTTSNDRFGFDTNYMVYCAFVDAADPGSIDPNVNAKVDSFNAKLVNAGTINEQIEGTFRVSGIDSGDQIIVEIWMVFSPTMEGHASGTIAAQLMSAQKALTPPEPFSVGSKTISLGNLSKTTALPPPQTQPPLGPLPPQPPILPGLTVNTVDRTWTAIDDCGNRSTCVQRLSIRDTTTPVLSLPADRVLECPADTATNNTGVALAQDACGGPVVITYSDLVSMGCAGTKVIARTWTASDQNGNTTNAVQMITLQDTTRPTITCASNKTVDPATAWTFDTPTASDLCGSVTVQVMSTSTNMIDPNTTTITRTWIAMDACANSSTCQQTVTLIKEAPPVLEISCIPSGMVQIRWSDLCVGYQLESSETLGANSWTPVAGVPIISNGFYVVEVAASAPPKFYRLRKSM